QDADPGGGRRDLRRAGGRRPHDEAEAQAEAPRVDEGHHAQLEEGDRRAGARRAHRAARRRGDGGVGQDPAMAIKKQKPTSPGRRFATWLTRDELTKAKPEKSLSKGKNRSGGRNSHGRITSRHRGG